VRDYRIRRLLLAADLLALALALVVALTIFPPERAAAQIGLGLATLPVWALIFKLYGLYDRDVKRISHTTVDDLPWIFHALLIGGLLLWLLYRAVPAGDVKALPVLGFAAIAMVAVPLARSIARRTTRRILGPERVLLVGDGAVIPALFRKMRAHPEYGLDPVGVVSPHADDGAEYPVPLLGHVGDLDLARMATTHKLDRLVVSHNHVDDATLLALMQGCRRLSLKLGLLPQAFDAIGPSAEIDDVEGVTVLGVNPAVLSRSSRLLKRTMDVVGASALLLMASPLMVLAAVAIKLDSPGSVFFRQKRIGKFGRRFRLVKFRTMVADAEQRRDGLLAQSGDPHWLLLQQDPRVTRVGRVLRITSVDELPQLWNVLKGEMSLVGPRPLIEAEGEQLSGWTRTRIDLTPGLTGLWQVLGRSNIGFEEMVKLDYLYVTNWSLWTDVRLLLRTLPAVMTRRGAN
jgi:exopolysaccharide biosynthesis polyprenyl glycosylphosphotransferase